MLCEGRWGWAIAAPQPQRDTIMRTGKLGYVLNPIACTVVGVAHDGVCSFILCSVHTCGGHKRLPLWFVQGS